MDRRRLSAPRFAPAMPSVYRLLERLSAALAQAAPLVEIGAVLHESFRATGVHHVALLTYDSQALRFAVSSAHGIEPAAVAATLDDATLAPLVATRRTRDIVSGDWLVVPLLYGGSLVGALAAGPARRARRHRRLIHACGDLLATAIYLASYFAALEQQFTEEAGVVAGVSDIARELNGTLDPAAISDLLLAHTHAVINAMAGAVLLASGPTLRLMAQRDMSPQVVEHWQQHPLSVANIAAIVGEREYRIVAGDQLPAALHLSHAAAEHGLFPLLHDNELRGVLLLALAQPLMPLQQRFLKQLAAHAALALSNAGAYNEIRQQHHLLDQRLAQLQAVSRISQAISAHLSLQALLPEIVGSVRTTLGYRVALLSLVDVDQPDLVCRVASIGVPDAEWQVLQEQVVPLSYYQSLMIDAYRVSRSYYIPHDGLWMADVSYDVILERSYRSDLEARDRDQWHPDDILLVPLYGHRGGLVGILSVDDPEDRRRPTPETMTVLEIFANQAASAIENARMFAEVERQALTDNLTGLANQRHFMMHLEQHISWARRHGQPLAVLALDIDHFKRYNDTFGHLAGNVVLREFAEVARQAVRASDLVARWGGEEFFALLPQSSREGALEVAERIREAVSRHPFPHDSLTVSLGVAMWEPGMSDQALLEAADAALYRAKRRRNTVAT
jgi:diguanylate cyclase (GGDEF)-like protein